METTQMTINRWINKEDVGCEILLSHKKEWKNAISSNMDKPKDCHTSEVSQTKTTIVYHLYVESKKMIQINL